jgi:hypothetical protein
MIDPTVGQVVWFYPMGNDRNLLKTPENLEEPLAAIIAAVKEPPLISLMVIDFHGHNHSFHTVVLFQGEEGEKVPDRSFAVWMPFQIGQAKKTEILMDDLEKRMKALEEELYAFKYAKPDILVEHHGVLSELNLEAMQEHLDAQKAGDQNDHPAEVSEQAEQPAAEQPAAEQGAPAEQSPPAEDQTSK